VSGRANLKAEAEGKQNWLLKGALKDKQSWEKGWRKESPDLQLPAMGNIGHYIGAE
jgi:hypothetical protein